MWGKKNTDEMSPLDTTVEHEAAWLGSSLEVKGEITGTEDLLIDGAVEGLIHLDERKLTVGTTAKVTADVNARDVVVYGYLKGNVRAKGRIEIKKDGAIIGKSKTARTSKVRSKSTGARRRGRRRMSLRGRRRLARGRKAFNDSGWQAGGKGKLETRKQKLEIGN